MSNGVSNALIGYGTTFARHDGAEPGVFVTTAEVASISGPGMARDSVDVTHLNSPDNYQQFRAGMKDGGEVSLEVHFIPGDETLNDDGLKGDFEGGEEHQYKIEFPDGSDFTFWAFVTSYEVSVGGHSEAITASIGLKVTGKPELTVAV